MFSFTVNSPRLMLLLNWYRSYVYEKKEGISDHPVALSSTELKKWKWPSAVQVGHGGFCLLCLDIPHQLTGQLMVEWKDPKAHLYLLPMIHPPQWVYLLPMWQGENVRPLILMPWMYRCAKSGENC